jgi:hypothetical protein
MDLCKRETAKFIAPERAEAAAATGEDNDRDADDEDAEYESFLEEL